jgi:diguanylate cyclase (GGDEF)-like protein
LRDCAKVLAESARAPDFVAGLGGDEFGVLAVETVRGGAEAKAARIRRALKRAGIEAAIGIGVRGSEGSFDTALAEADRAMYEEKWRSRMR